MEEFGVNGWVKHLLLYVTNVTNVANIASLPILTQTTLIFLNLDLLNLILVPKPAKFLPFHTANLVRYVRDACR